MGVIYTDDLIDEDEVPELTEEDFARMVPFSQLPKEEQEFLLQIKDATIRPRPVEEKDSESIAAHAGMLMK